MKFVVFRRLNQSMPLFKNFELDITLLIEALCTVLYKEKCILSYMFHMQLKCRAMKEIIKVTDSYTINLAKNKVNHCDNN